MTTMTKSEENLKYDLMDKYFDAMEAGDYGKAKEICKHIVITPEAAMQSFRSMGKERLLETGFNLSAANKAFGEGWLDEKSHRCRFR